MTHLGLRRSSRRQRRTLRAVLGGVASCGACFAACGGDGGPTVAGAGGTAGIGGSSAGGSSATGGSSASGTGGSSAFEGGVFFDGGFGASDAGLTADSACAGESQQAERIVVAMYIMLDASGSMNTGGRWTQASQAISTFANDPASEGLKVAIQSFGGEGPCDGSQYDTPAVPMGALPANASPITTWMSTVAPNGNTPTQGALLGLTTFAANYAAMNPTERTIGVLVTDGVPTRCDTSGGTLSGIAQASFNAGVSIYTMGMQGADFGLLNQISAAGGTTMAFDVTSGPTAFIQALEAIRGIALACEFSMPEAAPGETIDPTQVNVEFTRSGAGDAGTGTQQVGKVANEAGCAGVPWGWYYDDDALPTKILFCPDTCSNAKQDPQGKVSIIVGCASVPPV